MHAETRTHKVRQAAKLCLDAVQRISCASYVWAADMISAPWTGVVLSPLKRCRHNAFIFSPLVHERDQGCHLMVRMHSTDTAGLSRVHGGRGRGNDRVCVSCRSVRMFGHAFVFVAHYVAIHCSGVL